MTDDWKKKLGAATVYSTNPDFKFETEEEETETLPNNKQQLIVSIDKKQRKGKTVTLIEGFIGKTEDLEALAGNCGGRTCDKYRVGSRFQ